MVANQTQYFRLEQWFVMKFLMAKKCKSYEINKIMCDVNGEVCFSQKSVYKLDKQEFAIMNLS